MTEAFITLRGAKAEAFERVKEEMGPENVDLSNPAVVMRLIEMYEMKESEGDSGSLINFD